MSQVIFSKASTPNSTYLILAPPIVIPAELKDKKPIDDPLYWRIRPEILVLGEDGNDRFPLFSDYNLPRPLYEPKHLDSELKDLIDRLDNLLLCL